MDHLQTILASLDGSMRPVLRRYDQNCLKEEATAEAAKMIAEANAYKETAIANAQRTAAGKIAEAVKLEGDAEAKLQKAFANKRTHEEIMRKIDAVSAFAGNNKSVIFGDQGQNLMAQVESYKMVNNL